MLAKDTNKCLLPEAVSSESHHSSYSRYAETSILLYLVLKGLQFFEYLTVDYFNRICDLDFFISDQLVCQIAIM